MKNTKKTKKTRQDKIRRKRLFFVSILAGTLILTSILSIILSATR